MSDRVTDDIRNLVRRVARLLNRKVSDVLMLLFNHKTAGSLGALTGFAIAVVFAWKFFRSPPGMRRITPSTSQPAGGVGSSSEGLAPVLDMKVSDAAEAISASIQLSLDRL